MYCNSCGAKIADSARFCPKCGATLVEVSPVRSATSQTAERTVAPQLQVQNRPAVELRPKPRGRRMAASVLLAMLLAAGGAGFAWYRGLLDLSFPPSLCSIESAVADVTPIAITVEAPGLDNGGSRIPMRVQGTTSGGYVFEQQIYLSLAENEPLMLEDGTYKVEIIGSPISSDGVIYHYEEGSAVISVVVSKDETATPSVVLELKPIEAAEVTNEKIDQAVQWVRDDPERADRAEELAHAASTRRDEAVPIEKRVVASYETVLDNAASYFAQDWRGIQPEGDLSYLLLEMTGDDIPELLLVAPYQLTEPWTSIGRRMIPFVFDTTAGGSVPAIASDGEFEMLECVDTEYYAADGHSLVYATRTGSNAEYPYYRVWIDGTELKYEGMSEDIRTADVSLGSPVTDRSYLNALFGESVRPEVSTEQASEHDFECDWFWVDVPDSWPDDFWSVEQTGDGEWRFVRGSGHDDGGETQIKVSVNGSPEGYADLVGNAIGPDGQTVGVYKRGAGASFFGEGKATLNLKSV